MNYPYEMDPPLEATLMGWDGQWSVPEVTGVTVILIWQLRMRKSFFNEI